MSANLAQIEHKGSQCTGSSCSISSHNHTLQQKAQAPKLHVHSPSCNHKHDHKHTHEDTHAPKLHVSAPKPHVHGPSCNHKHDHKHVHEDTHASKPHVHKQTSLWPLEDFIAHAPMPKWLRELTLNTSFLSPALIVSTLLEHAKIPKLMKTWLAITAMHGMNRGTQKLSRLGLTYLISAAASAGSGTKLGAGVSRFIATTCVALVEKFSGSGHHQSGTASITSDLSSLLKNIGSKKQWIELLPSLFNIEAKVQVVAPLVNKFIAMLSSNLQGSSKTGFDLFSKIILTSLSFVGTDKALMSILKRFGGEASSLAASFSAICGCCASPVCSAAATDTALSNIA